MRRVVEKLVLWLEAKTKTPPVPGWLMEFMLLLAWVVAYTHGYRQEGVTLLVGSIVIGVVRMIERDRRKRGV